MRCASALLLLVLPALAGAINTDSALTEGVGQVVTRTKLRWVDLESEVDAYLAQQTVLYGATPRLSILSTLAYQWNDPGPNGLTDLALRGRFKFFYRDARRETLSLAALLGYEIPVGEEPIGSPNGGLIAGVTGTWEKNDWRIDADFVNAFRPDVADMRKADLAVSRNFALRRESFWIAVLELNYERTGSSDVLFLSPGLVYERVGWKFEFSLQIAVAEDASGPAPNGALVLSVVHAF